MKRKLNGARNTRWYGSAAAAVVMATILAGCAPTLSGARPDVVVSAFEHVHGLGVDSVSGVAYAATHEGVFILPPLESATGSVLQLGGPVSGRVQDTMAFTVQGSRMYASGHPGLDDAAKGAPQNLGLITSIDGAATWKTLSLGGEADFHDLAVVTDPSGTVRIYGYNAGTGTVMFSGDGGSSWTARAKLALRDLAADPTRPGTVYATTAEGLAFGTLLSEGFDVRLTGQDVGRGTFSQRHAIWYDQSNENKHIPLKHIRPKQSKCEIYDSPLSEMAVLGFEYGYSLADPKTLVLWEAQFGDFVNGAQVIIDQFICSGESKWLRMSGLVMLLPHGYEGQGPEHSSARPERFLQNCAEDNWQIVNCTTPANYFHVLRRQMHRDFRKPLVMMTPKSLLRHKLAVSKVSEFTTGSSFHRVLWDDDRETLAKPDKIKRVVLCTGKVYFDLLQARRDKKIDDITILRVEQMYPFPINSLGVEIAPFKNAEVVWCQEEPKNQGAWSFAEPYIEETLSRIKHKSARPRYIGREASAAPATGLNSRHVAEQNKLVNEALTV